VIEGLKIDETSPTTRPFHRKFWGYFKQGNPIINTWKYYMRLQPRWTRACFILIAFQINLLIVQPDSSLLNAIMSSIFAYFVGLYLLPLAFTVNV
jgi:hypothetical protein